jgi:hypothetical protein
LRKCKTGCDNHYDQYANISCLHKKHSMILGYELIDPCTRSLRKERGTLNLFDFNQVLPGLQILDDLHALFWRELAADYAVAFGAVVEFVSGVGVAR